MKAIPVVSESSCLTLLTAERPVTTQSQIKHLHTYCQASAATALALALMNLSGWMFHIALLTSFSSGHVTTKVNTAVCLGLASTSRWLLIPTHSAGSRGKVARILAVLVLLIAAASLSEYIFKVNLGVDQLWINGLLLVSSAIFFVRPGNGIAKDLIGGPGSFVARRFLPAVFITQILFDWICRYGQKKRMYGPEFTPALNATLNTLAFAVLIWSSARQVDREQQDTGGGIPEKVRSRIFDPFFTTKEIGKGTGQGLAIARSVVVDMHQGTIDFETADGYGTTFIIRLPFEAVPSPDLAAA
jgi:hypothetical protein